MADIQLGAVTIAFTADEDEVVPLQIDAQACALF
jgi:hypothetical protein